MKAGTDPLAMLTNPKKKDSIDGEDDIKLEKPSYTYWKRDSDKQADHTGFMPQPTILVYHLI